MEPVNARDFGTGQLNDREIVSRVVAGEKELFEILLRRYNQTLYRVIRSYLKEQDDVQDAMQNTYLKAFDKLFQFQGNASFATWLIRIGINEALLRLNELSKGRLVFMRSDTLSVDQISDKYMNPEHAIIRQEVRQLLEQAVDHLPEKYRIVYMLKEVEGLESAHIGECLGLTEANIKVRLHRAKKLLKESLLELTSKGTIFEFGNNRCDAMVAFVMSRI